MLLSMSQESWIRNGTVSQNLLGIELSSRQLMFCCWQTRHLLSAISIGRFIYISLFTLPSSMKCGNGTTEQPFCLFPLLKPTIKMRTIKPTIFSSVSLVSCRQSRSALQYTIVAASVCIVVFVTCLFAIINGQQVSSN